MQSQKTILIILFLLTIFSLSYLKNTYVINLFSSDYSLLIRRFYGPEIHHLGRPLVENDIGSNPRGLSAILFHVLFAAANSGFIFLIFKKATYQKHHWIAFGSLSIIVILAYAAFIGTGAMPFYDAAVIVKDFLQSSIYSFVLVIIALNYGRLKAV
jgi:hypothetical protein